VVAVVVRNKHTICAAAEEVKTTTSTTKSGSQTIVPHEYIRDTLTFRYGECRFCGTRTELTCIKCGFCYSCHWKKEKVEKQLLDSRYHNSPPLIPSRKNELIEEEKYKEKEEQPQEQKQQQLIMNVFGQVSEPICTYYRYHHKFSLHGSTRCWCRHPTNKTQFISW
jgi:hypothetical protein